MRREGKRKDSKKIELVDDPIAGKEEEGKRRNRKRRRRRMEEK